MFPAARSPSAVWMQTAVSRPEKQQSASRLLFSAGREVEAGIDQRGWARRPTVTRHAREVVPVVVNVRCIDIFLKANLAYARRG